MARKLPTADRTVDMFTGKTVAEEALPIEVIEEEPKAEFEPMEARADGYRERAFQVQEWTEKHFGKPEGTGNQYRVSRKGDVFYLEELKRIGDKSFYGYVGLMLHGPNFLQATRLMAEAARAYDKELKEKNGSA